MKKVVFIITLIFVCFPTFAQLSYDELDDSQVVKELKEDISYLSSSKLDGRRAGSYGEQMAAEYVYKKFTDMGLTLLSPKGGDVFSICRHGQDTIISRNVVACIPGSDKELKNEYIVVGARLDNGGVNYIDIDGKKAKQVYYGANGNASGLAMMLQLAKKVKVNASRFRRSVIFVAFGASNEAYAGAWYFLNKSFGSSNKIAAMINLDMIGLGDDKFIAYTANNKDLNSLLELSSKELHPVYPKLETIEPYPSDSRAFYSSKIPSVYFTSGYYSQHDTDRDTKDILLYGDMERELEFIYCFTEDLANENIAPKFIHDQQDADDSKIYKYYDCQQLPTFMGHSDPIWFMKNWVYQYQKYPDKAVENGIQGKVGIGFIINKKGNVTNVRVTKSVDPLLDNEAIRIIQASPDWKPGRINGKKVDAYLELIIDFRLIKNK